MLNTVVAKEQSVTVFTVSVDLTLIPFLFENDRNLRFRIFLRGTVFKFFLYVPNIASPGWDRGNLVVKQRAIHLLPPKWKINF